MAKNENIIQKLNIAKFAVNAQDRIRIIDEVIKELAEIEDTMQPEIPEKPKKPRGKKKTIEVPVDPTIKEK